MISNNVSSGVSNQQSNTFNNGGGSNIQSQSFGNGPGAGFSNNGSRLTPALGNAGNPGANVNGSPNASSSSTGVPLPNTGPYFRAPTAESKPQPGSLSPADVQGLLDAMKVGARLGAVSGAIYVEPEFEGALYIFNPELAAGILVGGVTAGAMIGSVSVGAAYLALHESP
jgi:hypothetical protein